MKKLNLNRLARKSLDKVMNESFTARTNRMNQSDLTNRADEMVKKKHYSVILYWEASITDDVFADSEEEAIEIALERNKNRIDSASRFVSLYDSKSGTCPNHTAFED